MDTVEVIIIGETEGGELIVKRLDTMEAFILLPQYVFGSNRTDRWVFTNMLTCSAGVNGNTADS